jgi:hypothetical protein
MNWQTSISDLGATAVTACGQSVWPRCLHMLAGMNKSMAVDGALQDDVPAAALAGDRVSRWVKGDRREWLGGSKGWGF